MLEQLAGTALTYGLGMAGAQNQNDYNKEAMGLQYSYNSMMQQKGQNNNKEMWDYTNYENQVKHMKSAGLNPALLYGMGGGGGSSTSGAQGSATSAVGGNELQAGSSLTGMALQAGMLQSQIKVNEAQAEKLEAEATKTRGVDTELGKAETELKRSLQALTENQATGAQWDYQKGQATIENIQALTKKANAEAKEAEANAEVASKTINANIELASQKVAEIKSNIALNHMHTEESKQKIQNLKTDIVKAFNDMKVSNNFVQQGWGSQEQNWQKIYNDLKLGERKLDQNEEFFAKDLFHSLMNLVTFGK